MFKLKKNITNIQTYIKNILTYTMDHLLFIFYLFSLCNFINA